MTALRVQYRRSPADMQSRIHPSSAGPPGDRHEQQATHDPSEAFVETLVAQGVKDVFGIVGSAFMDALDLFPAAGIRFVPTVHEQGAAHMADGYSRVTGRHGVCIAQNGPHHQFRDGRGGGLLGAQPGGGDHARDRHVRHGPGRLPGNRAVADLLAHHQVPGACEPRRPHGRVHGQGFRQRHGRARPGAAEHSARLFLRRDRRGDSRAAPRVAARAPRKTWRRRPGCWPRRASR